MFGKVSPQEATEIERNIKRLHTNSFRRFMLSVGVMAPNIVVPPLLARHAPEFFDKYGTTVGIGALAITAYFVTDNTLKLFRDVDTASDLYDMLPDKPGETDAALGDAYDVESPQPSSPIPADHLESNNSTWPPQSHAA